MTPDRLKIYLADDHQILLDGLISFFREIGGIEVVGSANDGSTLLRDVYKKQPDIILLDLNMPKLDGMKTLERLRKEYPQIKVIVLSNYHQSQFIKEARDHGASGYVLKNGSKEELLDAIDAVKNGGQYFKIDGHSLPDEAESLFADDFIRRYQLTKREIEIIKLVCAEMSTRQISEKLFVSEYTVNTHRKNILRKLNVKNSVGMINFARESGLV